MTKESKIELEFIEKLKDLKYVYRDDIRTKEALNQNFRKKFEELNYVNLSDAEFARLLDSIITGDVYNSAKLLREKNTFIREDGTPLHYTLVNIKDWCKNSYEVINQLRINTDNSFHRYDVILLINGVPVVQVELKTLEISPRRAMQQIVDYKNDVGNGYTKTLLSFIQLFIVSNQTNTWYFANNNERHFSFDADERFLPIYKFADKNNNKITQLNSFAEHFLTKCILGEMISRYMVLVATEQKILMMRPYQMYAVKEIVNCIEQNCGNGFIWHTTGSGKTLTSFKASTLLKDNPNIEKCLFVVDRKDLDRQTREEFNKFQENCVEENTNTDTLVKRLLSTDYADKIIVTTIQKLGLALDENHVKNYKEKLKPLQSKRVIFIFDECHRSQFGENHKAIKEFFPNAQLFGFTGTPIFDENSTIKKADGTIGSYMTTVDVFENELHTYTISNAIEDENVLRFHIDYYKPDTKVKIGETITKKAIVEAIIDKHDSATASRKFNAIFATASINDAIEYHKLFKDIQSKMKESNEEYTPLNIACVFSPPVSVLEDDKSKKDIKQLQEDLEQEKADNEINPNEKKEELKIILEDYNKQFGTNHNISNFDLYYQDVQKRIKDQKYPNKDYSHKNKIDIVIVVDMLLTGFDSQYLNTLYVDKNLKYHGLIQAFSRTNRILNDTKPYGNILDFRGQEEAVNQAITRFSGKSTKDPKKIWLVDSAPIVIENLNIAVEKLDKFMFSQGLENKPEEVSNLKGDEARGQFINLFKEVQRLKTQLDQYTDLTDENNQTIEQIIPKDTLRAFKGMYLETAQRLKEKQAKNSDTSNPIEQLDFEFVLFAHALVDYDFIMGLIARYTGKSKKQKMTKEQLMGIIDSDAKFIDEKDDIRAYIDTLEIGSGLNEEDIKKGYEDFKSKLSNARLDEIAIKHNIDKKAFHDFIELIMNRMIFDGEYLNDLLAPQELGWKARAKKELELMEDLIPLLKKLAGEQEISGLSAYE
ncbi:type I restriction endonuclease subunit R [Aliarcobacter skirrowii]|uniref:Type I restriction enzyme endonuclease subunit n=1 Tax=Aliarcobacter skirrowii TaxID=28200 RepID=A0A2U2C0B7_9BACT|nr:type I restriction endonuclease subunit R [Aliarcobacter skirrowii]PWE20538.1 DEAD/DEAH box helicase [Aliarcobacter skirrowii]PWE21128.1 DEAD/DEAH box helicase [Aliarcobacter skirrowii]PWE26405.1 DEAD/DEAH box helicase [Aliarcobacter skirrowii]RJO55737.1 type I restriction endonuclease subunit R [Aliarcobacter skirrowii]RJO57692.1 type I restriction endonuclease subunit R [Aliarcobacter skirrowii]